MPKVIKYRKDKDLDHVALLTDADALLWHENIDSAFRKAKSSQYSQYWAIYKRLIKRTQQQIRYAKVRFYHRTLPPRQSSRLLWNRVKGLGIGKSNVDTPVSLNIDVINDYFVNFRRDEYAARDYVSELRAASRDATGCRFSFAPVSEADVLVAFSRMTINVVGDDYIPLRF
ncbi:hypothetical protein J6590_065193 [Homalodisca vitripennis]|nr:hypothetical protein J6590_065193 [Homalodisca vitripennis]